MTLQPQQNLFHESFAESLRTAVQALGGFKKVGVMLWPELPADRAGRDLADCLQVGASRKLSLEQLEFLIVRGREVQCHAPMTYLCEVADYEQPLPRDPETFAQREKREIAAVLKTAIEKLTRLEQREALHNSPRRIA